MSTSHGLPAGFRRLAMPGEVVMSRIPLFLLPLVLLSAAHASAQQPACNENGTQGELNVCAAPEYGRTDARLNEAYGELMKQLADDPEERQFLKDAQRAWIVFRDAECAFAVGQSSGGSVYPMVLSNCLNAVTERRLQRLKDYLHCQEGDLSCPVPPQ